MAFADHLATENDLRGRSIVVLALVVLAALVSFPIWSSAQFFASHDGLLHVWRVFALDRAVYQGLVDPRWLPDLAYGLGYPIFEFYPPLSEYVAETIHLLGASFPDSVKYVLIIAIFAAAVGAYKLGADLAGERGVARTAGVVTAAAYVFFPYLVLDIYTRGALAEVAASALVPWTFWAVHHLVTETRIGSVVLVGLLLAALVLVHSLTVAILAPVLVLYVLVELAQLQSNVVRALSYVTIAVVIGIAVSAFYWLPFIAGLPETKMGNGIPAVIQMFSGGFFSISSLVQPSLTYQYADPRFTLGLVPVALGIGACVLVVANRQFRRYRYMLFFGVCGLIAAIAMSEPARSVWLAIPWSTLVQFPWRVSLVVALGEH